MLLGLFGEKEDGTTKYGHSNAVQQTTTIPQWQTISIYLAYESTGIQMI